MNMHIGRSSNYHKESALCYNLFEETGYNIKTTPATVSQAFKEVLDGDKCLSLTSIDPHPGKAQSH